MAYFSKDIYDRKRDYAYRISKEGLEKIALYLVSENPKYKNADLDDEDVQDKIDKEIEDLIYELEPIAELSHLRHNVHSDGHDTSFDFSFQDSEIIDDANEINKKYNLNKNEIPHPNTEDLPSLDDDNWLLCEEFDLNEDEWLDEYGDWIGDKYEDIYEMVVEKVREEKDRWSDSVRQWFREINKKFDTDFPD